MYVCVYVYTKKHKHTHIIKLHSHTHMHMVWEEVCVREPRQRESDIERQTHRNRQRETYINTTLDSRIASASQSSVKAFILCVCWKGGGGFGVLCAVDADLCEFGCLLHYIVYYITCMCTHSDIHTRTDL